jgi:hypothetical protein
VRKETRELTKEIRAALRRVIGTDQSFNLFAEVRGRIIDLKIEYMEKDPERISTETRRRA